MQFASQLTGIVESEQGRIGTLSSARSEPCGFAQGGSIARDVEDVVLHLEGESDGGGKGLQGGEGGGFHVSLAQGAEGHGALDEGPGLVAVHLLQLGEADPAPFGVQIQCLTAAHAR